MGRSKTLPLLVLSIAAGAALYPAPLPADWLVTRDGGRIETKGKWRVEGAKVVFDLPNGTMGVLRKSEVDLDASAAASAASAAPAAAPAAPGEIKAPLAPLAPRVPKASKEAKRAPILTLTDKDVPKARAEESADPATQPPPATTETARAAGVEVQSWRQSAGESGGIEITGMVKNVGSDVAANITLEVAVVDEQGKTHSAAGFLEKTSLVREKDTFFRALLPDVSQIVGAPSFKLTADGASIGADPPSKPN